MIRGTLFFQNATDTSKQTWGWTESIAMTQASLDQALQDLKDLAVRRSTLLGSTSLITYVRVVTLGKPRDSLIYSNVGNQTATWGTFKDIVADSTSDIPNTAILFRAAASPTIFRSYLLRGIPDSQVSGGGQFDPIPQYATALNQWKTRLSDGRFGIPVNAVGNTPKVVATVLQDPNFATVTITFAADPGFAIADRITLKGGRGAVAIHGTRTLLTRSPDGLSYTFPFTTLIKPYLGGMTATKLSGFTVAPINTVTTMYTTHRITGRPSFSAHGRRRKAS
jgi:hypothetical protein